MMKVISCNLDMLSYGENQWQQWLDSAEMMHVNSRAYNYVILKRRESALWTWKEGNHIMLLF